MSLQKVNVINQMDSPIWVVIAENQSHIISSKTHRIAETEFEQYYRFMLSGNVTSPLPEIPVDASYQAESEYKTKLRQYYETHQETTYQWSGFIEAGELEIAPHSHNLFTRKGDESLYYLSVRSTKMTVIADAVPRSEPEITIDNSGHIVEPEPVKPPQPQVINASSKVFFKHTKKVIGDPQTHLNWPCATIGNTGGAGHIIKPWSGALANNSLVRILTKDRTVAKDGYHHMYCSDIGNVYYDKQRANKKQQWKIMKTNAKTNSPGNDLCYGDTVKIANGKWSKANLGINGKWCQCVNDDSTVWVLVKKP